MINSTNMDPRLNRSSKRLVQLFLVITRTLCNIIFLSSLVEYRVMPNFVNNLFNHFPFQDRWRSALNRKVSSLKMEILRTTLCDTKLKLKRVEREIGYEYLTVMRSASDAFITEFLDMVVRMLFAEEKILFQRHSTKWQTWTKEDYPLSIVSYHVSHKPCFHFSFRDSWWPEENLTTSASTLHSARYVVNDSEHALPTNVEKLLEKGPKFRIPLRVTTEVVKETEKQLESLTYRLRYDEHRKQGELPCRNNLVVPYSKNTVVLPPKMNSYQEGCLIAFKHEVLNLIEKESKILK